MFRLSAAFRKLPSVTTRLKIRQKVSVMGTPSKMKLIQFNNENVEFYFILEL